MHDACLPQPVALRLAGGHLPTAARLEGMLFEYEVYTEEVTVKSPTAMGYGPNDVNQRYRTYEDTRVSEVCVIHALIWGEDGDGEEQDIWESIDAKLQRAIHSYILDKETEA